MLLLYAMFLNAAITAVENKELATHGHAVGEREISGFAYCG